MNQAGWRRNQSVTCPRSSCRFPKETGFHGDRCPSRLPRPRAPARRLLQRRRTGLHPSDDACPALAWSGRAPPARILLPPGRFTDMKHVRSILKRPARCGDHGIACARHAHVPDANLPSMFAFKVQAVQAAAIVPVVTRSADLPQARTVRRIRATERSRHARNRMRRCMRVRVPGRTARHKATAGPAACRPSPFQGAGRTPTPSCPSRSLRGCHACRKAHDGACAPDRHAGVPLAMRSRCGQSFLSGLASGMPSSSK